MPRKPTKSANLDSSGACRVPVAIPVRGAPRNNRNALRHGAFGAPGRERRAAVRALIDETEALIRMVEAIAQESGSEARGFLRRPLARKVQSIQSLPPIHVDGPSDS